VTDRSVLSLLIPAVGGQGGGVLLEWIVDAATVDGYPVHGTSIPGVAQRTGSTSYYIELATERGGHDDAPPIFSLYPVPGALDVLLAPEFLEVSRSIELGFPSPTRTTIIASTHRLYSIHEKIVTGRGIYPIERLQEAVTATLTGWIDRLHEANGGRFPEKVTAFRPEMAVHGRYKQACPVCGAPVQRIVYAENECNYCARCQTGGRRLADRSLSRLLREDWPRSIDEG